jgi:hypothetical protein
LENRLNGKKAAEQFADPEVIAIFDGSVKLFRRVGYSKSFALKREQAPQEILGYYEKIKNALTSYPGAVSKISMVNETISVGKCPLAKLIFTSHALVVCLALEPEKYFGTEYSFKDVSYYKKYQKVPFCIKISDAESMQDALELIDELSH